ncbi:MAG: GPW/gp25 family protein [Spirulina sp.]
MPDSFNAQDIQIVPPVPPIPAISEVSMPRSLWRQAKLSEIGNGVADSVGAVVTDLADVAQCIQIILTTPKGTDPYRPDFALEILDYLDWPIQKATPFVVREAMRAVLTWEPRVEVTKVGVRYDGAPLGQAYISVEWRLKDPPRSTQVQITEALFGRTVYG